VSPIFSPEIGKGYNRIRRYVMTFEELQDKYNALVTRTRTYEKIFEALGCKSYEDLVAAYDAVGRALGVDQGETFEQVNAELMEVESEDKEEVL
jgi:hypothetical protein